jgi:hypothetical protein
MKHLLSVGGYTLASLLLAVMVQANIFPTTPVSSTRVPAGGVLNTQWIESNEAPFANQSSSYDLFLMTGGDLNQVQVSLIGTKIPISKTSVPFTLPDNLPPGAYFVKFVVGGQSVFSTRFIVTNKAGEVVSTATDVDLSGFLNNANATSTSTAEPTTNGTSNATETSTSVNETSTSDDGDGDEDGSNGDGTSDDGTGGGDETSGDNTGEGGDDGTTGGDGENSGTPSGDDSTKKINKTTSTSPRRSSSSDDTLDEDAANSRYAVTSSLVAAIAGLFLAALA